MGLNALLSNTTGNNNTAYGNQSLNSNTTGNYNTALGMQALINLTAADNNTAVGYQAGYSNTAANNTFIGAYSGYSVTSGTANTFIGNGQNAAGYYVTTGSKNTIIGGYSGNNGGLDIRTSSNYIVLSDGDGNPRAYNNGTGTWFFGTGGASNYEGTILLNGASGSGYGPIISANTSGTASFYIATYTRLNGGSNTGVCITNQVGYGVYLATSTATSWTAVSDETRKIIIEPITGGLEKIATLRTVIGRLKTDEEDVRRPYLIAQDVQKVLPEAVTETEDKEGTVLGLSYTEVIPLLVNAIQELKAEVDSLKTQLGAK